MRSESSVSDRTRGVLAYRVGGVWFGARVEECAGLMQADRPAPLPRQREPLSGVIAFRGAMVPTFEIANYLGLDSSRAGSTEYALILTRGTDRFGVMIPEIPHLVHAKDLREADLSVAEPELQSILASVFDSGELRIHCLDYWSIIDSILPPSGAAPPSTAGH